MFQDVLPVRETHSEDLPLPGDSGDHTNVLGLMLASLRLEGSTSRGNCGMELRTASCSTAFY